MEVLQAQVVACVEAESYGAGFPGGIQEGRYRFLAVGRIAGCIRLCVKLHAVGAALLRPVYHRRVGVNEDRRAYARLAEAAHHVGEQRAVGPRVPAVVRRYLVLRVGNERHLRRLHLQYEAREAVYRVALNVELSPDERPQCPHVGVAYVAFVGPRVHGYALGAEQLAVLCHAEHVGVVAAPGVADGRHLVDVNA